MKISLSEDHKYTVDGVRKPSVTEILEAIGFIDKQWYTEYGRDRGSHFHLARHYYDENDLDTDTLDPAIEPYLEGYKKFRRDNEVIIVESEVEHYNETWGFCGKPDADIILNGHPTVVDFKTGKLMAWTALQLVLYSLFYDTPRKRLGVQINANGTYKLFPFTDRRDMNTALSAVHCYKWQLNHGRKEL